jgi:hypothetical protein
MAQGWLAVTVRIRLSADVCDIGYHAAFPLAEVRFNGAKLHGVITADERRGEVLVYRRDETGKLVVNEYGEPVTDLRFGRVEISVPSNPRIEEELRKP